MFDKSSINVGFREYVYSFNKKGFFKSFTNYSLVFTMLLLVLNEMEALSLETMRLVPFIYAYIFYRTFNDHFVRIKKELFYKMVEYEAKLRASQKTD